MSEVSQDLIGFIKSNNPHLSDEEVMTRAREISGVPEPDGSGDAQKPKPVENATETKTEEETSEAVKQFREDRLGQWAQRIERLEMMNPLDVVANDKNWRLHPDVQQEAMSAVLNEIGWIGALLWNETTGKLIDGHLRLSQAIDKGQEKVPVLVVNLSEEEENLALISFDPISSMAATDAQKFDELTKNISADIDTSLKDLIRSTGAAAGLYGNKEDIDDMADDYGVDNKDEDVDTDLYPDIRVKQVEPAITRRWEYAFRAAVGKTESEKMGYLVDIMYQNTQLAGRARKIEQDDKVAAEA